MTSKAAGRALSLLLTLAGLLTLGGCASMLEREYVVTAQHVEDQPPGKLAYRVETYPALRSALESYVEEGMDTGVLHFPTTYAGNLSVDMEKARRQLLEEDALGSYALSGLDFHISRIIAYYEVSLSFAYKAPKEELAGLQTVEDQERLAALLGEDLEELRTRRAVLLTDCPQEGELWAEEALAAAWEAFPALGLELPELTATFYPQTGERRVAVLELQYDVSTVTAGRRRAQTEAAAEALSQDLAQTGEQSPEGVFQALKAHCTYDPEGGGTAYDALVSGRANDRGLTLAYALLCRASDLNCGVARQPQGCFAVLGEEGENGSPAGTEGTLYLDLTAPDFAPAAEVPQGLWEGELEVLEQGEEVSEG